MIVFTNDNIARLCIDQAIISLISIPKGILRSGRARDDGLVSAPPLLNRYAGRFADLVETGLSAQPADTIGRALGSLIPSRSDCAARASKRPRFDR